MTTLNNIPDTYRDDLETSGCTEWDNDRLEALVTKYSVSLDRAELGLRAQAVAARIISHATFELAYRAGEYGDTAEVEMAITADVLEVANADI